MEENFNDIKIWMMAKLGERRISINKLVRVVGPDAMSPSTIWNWYSGKFQPSIEAMTNVCEALSLLPIIKDGEPPRYEEVPLDEAMTKFTPFKPSTQRRAGRKKR